MDEDSLTKEDFLKAFEAVVKQVKTVEAKLMKDAEALADLVKKAESNLDKASKTELSKLKQELQAKIEVRLDGATKEMSDSLNFVRDKVRDLKDGKDADEQKIVDTVIAELVELSKASDSEKQIFDTPEQIRDKLSNLPEGERLEAQYIDGLVEIVTGLIPEQKSGGAGIAGRDFFVDIDLSSDLDGSTKTFNIPAVYNILSVSLSSFPHALRKGVDFTYTGTTITFTDEIDASTSLATGQTCVLTVVTP